MSRLIQVRFTVWAAGGDPAEIKGEVTHDPAGQRRKIVFVSGYKEHWRTWSGQLPRHLEEWVCEVLKDTAPENPDKGTLLVRLVRQAKEEIWWDCSPNKGVPELFGAKPPLVKCVVRFGVREERTDEYRVDRTADIGAAWPEHVRAEAARVLADYAAARERFAALVQWPTTLPSDPNDHDLPVEVGGYQCRISTRVGVSPSGLERYWSLTGPVEVQGPPQLLSGELKAEAGKEVFMITRYDELRTLCTLFGVPEIMGAAFDQTLEGGCYTRGQAHWGKLQLALDPKAIFGGPYGIDIAGVDQYGHVTCRVTSKGLGLTAEIGGFRADPERQQAVYGEGREWREWRVYSNTGIGRGGPPARPVVVPAQVNWCAQRYLSEGQRRQLVEGVAKWSLADHLQFFRWAMCQHAWLAQAQEAGELLRRLLAEKQFCLQSLPYRYTQYEGESPDGMRGPSSWTVTCYEPSLVGSLFRAVSLKGTTFTNDLDGAIRWYVGEVAQQLRHLIGELREAFGSHAQYEQLPTYREPVTMVTDAERQEVDRKIEGLLTPLESVLEAAATLFGDVIHETQRPL